MKKISILITLVLLAVITVVFALPKNKLKAITDPVGYQREIGSWSIYPLYSDYWAMKLTYPDELDNEPTFYDITIPASSDNLTTTSSLNTMVRILHSTGNIDFTWSDLIAGGLVGSVTAENNFTIDTRGLFLGENLALLNDIEIEVFIAQTPTSDSGYRVSTASYFNSSTYSYYMYRYYIGLYHSYDGSVLYTEIVKGLGNTPIIADYTPASEITINSITYNFIAWYLLNEDGTKTIFYNDIVNYIQNNWFEETDNIDEVDTIKFYPYYVSNLIVTKYYKGNILDTEIININTLPSLEDPSIVDINALGGYPEGESFYYWEFADGILLTKLYTKIPDKYIIREEFINGMVTLRANLYASSYASNPIYESPSSTDNTPDTIRTLFAGFGLDNDVGYFLSLLLIFLGLTILFASIKAPIIIYLVGYIGVISLYTWLGLIPIFATVILYLLAVLLGALMINARAEGGNYE